MNIIRNRRPWVKVFIAYAGIDDHVAIFNLILDIERSFKRVILVGGSVKAILIWNIWREYLVGLAGV